MELFEIYKFVHITTAIIWVGGGVLGAVYTERAKNTGAVHRLGIARDMEFVALRVFNPAAIVTLIFGILMVLEADPFEFSQAWIVMGFSGVAVSAGLGMGYLGPQVKRLVGELEAGDAESEARLSAVSRVALLDVTVLLIVVWAMVFKPGF
jgi:uncharacterized membrane protein